MTTSDYLTQLQLDKQNMVSNLTTKGITGLTGDETFTELVPEVLNIPSGSGLDWTAIGYSGEPIDIEEIYNYSLQIKNNWDASQTSLQSKFQDDKELMFFPLVDTSNATTTRSMFQYCSSLRVVPLINTSNVTTTYRMFNGCTSLTTIPILNTSNLTTISNMFYDCGNLTNESLDNILQMCININSNYSKAKTLAEIGFTSSTYSTSRIQALPHYQAFINAGWTIGY